jgi:hypothetical protein
VFLDQPLTTNRWGMRNRDVTQTKPPGTYRIAFFGPSIVMGSGVSDGETLPAIVEDRLNATAPDGQRYEVLNFGVAGESMLEQLARLEERGTAFQPDAVFIADSQNYRRPIISHILTAIRRRTPIPYPGLEAIIREAGVLAYGNPGYPVPFEILRSAVGTIGVPARMPGAEATRRMRGVVDQVAGWTLTSIAGLARANGAVPVFVLLSTVDGGENLHDPVLRYAGDAGFVVFDLVDIWRDHDRSALRIAASDDHPNAAGNRLIAARLAELIQQRRAALHLEAQASR